MRMLQNYLKTALRNLWKHKLFSFINVFGLASGMLVCLLANDLIRNYPFVEATTRVIHQYGEATANRKQLRNE